MSIKVSSFTFHGSPFWGSRDIPAGGQPNGRMERQTDRPVEADSLFSPFATPNIVATDGGAGDSDSISGLSVLETLRKK